MKPDTRSFYIEAVQRVVSHLVARLDESADLHALARLAGLSPFHFHRVFRGMVGETPLELLRRLRLERAACALRDTSLPVTSVAFGAGYETHEAFTRAFRSAFGTSPTDFRRQRALRAVLSAPSGLHFRVGQVQPQFTPSDTGGHTMQVDIEQLPDLRLAAVTHVGPYSTIGKAFERLGRLAGPAGLFNDPSALMIALYHDDPDATPPEELRSCAAVSVAESAVLPTGVEELRLQGGSYARHTHVGAFDALNVVWPRFLGEALPASGYALLDGPALEIYRSDLRTTPRDEVRTDLLVPVRV
ncbi:MAG: AraC family transcriptional regulator [Gemmatimonadaceae bacterium]|nr:AraC family transcriptional regulator [Gemmatimonadaceae bacterium]